MEYHFMTSGTCSRSIDIVTAEDGTIASVTFNGGCPGNTVGVASLVRGLRPEKVVEMLRGIPCRDKATSCPDQLAQAMEHIIAAEAK